MTTESLTVGPPSSVVEHPLGKDEVISSILMLGSRKIHQVASMD